MATMDREHTVLDERRWSEIWVLDRVSGPRVEILYQCSSPYAYPRCRGMLASLLRRSQLPGENENRNWPVCKAPVSLKLGGADPRHFLRCTTCTRSVRRRALMVMNHSLACCFFSDAQKPRRRQFCLLLSLSYDGNQDEDVLSSSLPFLWWSRMERTRFDSRRARRTRAEKDFNKDGAKTKGNQQDMVQPRFDPDRFPFCSETFLHEIAETRYRNSLTTERKGELKSSELNSSNKKTNVSFKKSLKSL